MKKLLMLGGAYSQIPAIKCAKELGCYVITCDYLPNNPGHRYSDEYVNISTVDKESVLAYASANNIDAISAYASDPAAETAAYVCDAMHLPGAGLSTTKILARKHLFREFQKEHGFLYPKYLTLSSLDDTENIPWKWGFPCMVKPVDSSGSKGVTKACNYEELKQSVRYAFEFTRSNRIIIEEYISSPYDQIHGEGFAANGRLQFVHLGEQHFYNTVPIGTGCPCSIPEELLTKAENETARLIAALGFELGALNIELRIDDRGDVYIIEIGPRSGGNYMPELIECSSGFDEVKACMLSAMGRADEIKFTKSKSEPVFQYIIGSPRDGRFKELRFHDAIKDKIITTYLHKSVGDDIKSYNNSSGVVGVTLIRCDSAADMKDIISHIYNYVEVVLI